MTIDTRAVALRAGLHRGRIEWRRNVTSVQEIWNAVFFPTFGLIVMYMLRNRAVPETDFSLGSQAVPGILGMNVVLGGMMGMAITLTMDREDGTLLRLRATPNGMPGYLLGRVLSRAGMTLLGLLVPLLPAALLFTGLELDRPGGWLTLAWVTAGGLAAVLPFGAVLGALFRSSQAVGVVMLPMTLLLAVSGVFYPITAMPGWLQWIAQVFPIYWLGLGMRSALLPDSLAAAEIDGSWRHLETAAVLGAWAVAALAVAPIVLRRLARNHG